VCVCVCVCVRVLVLVMSVRTCATIYCILELAARFIDITQLHVRAAVPAAIDRIMKLLFSVSLWLLVLLLLVLPISSDVISTYY